MSVKNIAEGLAAAVAFWAFAAAAPSVVVVLAVAAFAVAGVVFWVR